jgi:hypothetical protein
MEATCSSKPSVDFSRLQGIISEGKKVKVSLCPNQHHAMKTLALGGGEWSASCLFHFTPGETAPGTHCIGSWVGQSAALDIMEKRKILSCGESNPDSSVAQPVA